MNALRGMKFMKRKEEARHIETLQRSIPAVLTSATAQAAKLCDKSSNNANATLAQSNSNQHGGQGRVVSLSSRPAVLTLAQLQQRMPQIAAAINPHQTASRRKFSGVDDSTNVYLAHYDTGARVSNNNNNDDDGDDELPQIGLGNQTCGSRRRNRDDDEDRSAQNKMKPQNEKSDAASQKTDKQKKKKKELVADDEPDEDDEERDKEEEEEQDEDIDVGIFGDDAESAGAWGAI